MAATGTGCRLLLLGATGAVGSCLLRRALEDDRVARVVAPTRRPLVPHPKLENPVVPLAEPSRELSLPGLDAVACALGTTIRDAGSQAAFARIDRDLPIEAARLARAAGARAFVLNSSLGASPAGNFYLRTKAEAESGIAALGYASVTIVRPSLIDAERLRPRPIERLGLLAARLLRPLLPRRYRAVTAEAVAATMIAHALAGRAGTHVVESEDITERASAA